MNPRPTVSATGSWLGSSLAPVLALGSSLGPAELDASAGQDADGVSRSMSPGHVGNGPLAPGSMPGGVPRGDEQKDERRARRRPSDDDDECGD